MTGGFCRDEMQLDRGIRRLRREIERTIAIDCQVPRIDPGQAIAVIETGLAETAAARFLVKEELLFRDVRHREMRELQIIDHEARGRRARVPPAAGCPAGKKSAHSRSGGLPRSREVAREIPPLGFELPCERDDRAETRICQPGSAICQSAATQQSARMASQSEI